MTTKTERMIALYRKGRVARALGIAKTFRIGVSREEKATLARAHEVLVRGGYVYEEMGQSPASLVAAGIALYESKWGERK